MSLLLSNLLRAAHYAGGMSLCDVLWGGDIKVLMYHGVTSVREFAGVTNYDGLNVRSTDFAEQLAYLKRHCNVVSLSDVCTASGLSRTRTNVVLSFDDGYENHFTTAFPLLERYGMPAVYAIPTAFVCDRVPLWNDAVEYVVNQTVKDHVCLRVGDRRREFRMTEARERLSLFRWLRDALTSVQQERRDEMARGVFDALGVTVDRRMMLANDDYRPLTAGQVSELAMSGLIEFASHSVHHYMLSKIDDATRLAELSESRRQIEDMTGLPCATLCLPGGAYNRAVLRDAFWLGYRSVLTSDWGRVIPGARVFNRIIVRHGMTLEKFIHKIHRRQ